MTTDIDIGRLRPVVGQHPCQHLVGRRVSVTRSARQRVAASRRCMWRWYALGRRPAHSTRFWRCLRGERARAEALRRRLADALPLSGIRAGRGSLRSDLLPDVRAAAICRCASRFWLPNLTRSWVAFISLSDFIRGHAEIVPPATLSAVVLGGWLSAAKAKGSRGD